MSLAGAILDQRFRIDARMGDSPGGALFCATDLTTGEVAAVKVLDPIARRSTERLAQRLMEFRLLKNLAHPGAPRVYQTGLAPNNRFYVAMELIEGPTLGEIIERQGPLAPLDIADILDQLAATLDAAHAVGIIHRAVTPANIRVHRDEAGRPVVKLLGFRWAKPAPTDVAAGDLPPPTLELGDFDPRHVSPEQVLGRRVTKLSDVYSLGVTLYAALIDRYPFDRNTPELIHRAHAYSPIPRFADARPRFPTSPQVEEVVRAALAKDPRFRPTSAGALASQFRAAATAAPAPSPTAASRSELLPSQTIVFPRRTRWSRLAWIIGGASLGALVGVLAAW